jgi:predicted nucleotidyltransferase
MTEKMKKRVEKAATLLKSAGCKEVFLFGSVAEGNDNENSDIDIAIKGCPPGRVFFFFGQNILLGVCRGLIWTMKMLSLSIF